MSSNEPKFKSFVEGAENLSLGISIVVAIMLGVGLGLLMKKYIGYDWLLWLGVFWGVFAAGINIKRAYTKQMIELDKLKDDPKYKHAKTNYDDDEDDDKY
jgi:F0F1-type ATP synthase assembly protein I